MQRPVHICEPNRLQTKCACVWTGLRICTVPSAYSSHTIHHKPKLDGILCEHDGNCAHRVDRVFMFANSKLVACNFCIFFNMGWSMFIEYMLKLWCQKLIYHVASANCTQSVQRNQGTPHVCNGLNTALFCSNFLSGNLFWKCVQTLFNQSHLIISFNDKKINK